MRYNQITSLHGDRLRETVSLFLRPVSFGYVAFLLAMLLFVWVARALGPSYSTAEYRSDLVPQQLIFYAILAIHFTRRVKQDGLGGVLSPEMCFLGLYTLVNFGYISLYTLGIVPYSREVFFFPTATVAALFAVNLGLIAFLLGYELAASFRGGVNRVQSVPVGRPTNQWLKLGMLVLIGGLLMHFAGLYLIGLGNIMRFGYAAIQDPSRFGIKGPGSLVLALASRAITIGVIIYVIASALRYGKLFVSVPGFLIVVGTIALFAIEGDRGPIVYTAVPMALVYHFFVRRVRVRYLALGFIAAIVVFPVLGAVRAMALRPGQMIQQLEQLREQDALSWYSAFYELGGSFNTLNITVHEVPDREPYWHGKSWLDATTRIIPFVQGFAMRQGWLNLSPSQWVTDTYWGPGRAGRAFSAAAEGYLNFGYAGVIIQLGMAGFVLRRLAIFFARRPSAIRAIIFLGCLGYIAMMVRNHMNVTLASCVHVAVIAWLLHQISGEDAVVQLDAAGAQDGGQERQLTGDMNHVNSAVDWS